MKFIFILTVALLLAAQPLLASETRGLRVVAKDSATNKSGEVKLYNKSYAVIIGIDRYPNLPQDRQLSYAVKDAKGIEQVLKRQYRFDRIVTLYDQQATKDRIQELLTEELPSQMGEDDSLFIFWAGHGNQEKKSEGDLGYLVPYDGAIGKLRTVITMDEIKNTVSKAIPAKHVFYVFDACYSGLLTTRAVDNKSRRDLSYLKEITRERVRQVLTAGGKDQQVLDSGRNGHSVFTGRLIEILEAKGDFVTANEIQAIIREKVSGDARARGHNQTPAFDAISGSGDFVFIPNIEQKVQDNRAEVARMEAELKRYEAQEAEARKHQTEQQQREAEQKRKAAEARLKAEQLRQQQLAEEAKRQQEMAQERARFEAEQKQREQEMTAAQRAEEQRLAALKAELAKKKQTAPTSATGSLTAAIAEIKRLNAEIENIESTFSRELSAGQTRISTRYNNEIAALKLASKQKQAPLVKDEFETDTEYRARSARQQSSYSDRINQLEQKKQSEISELQQRLAQEQHTQTADLRQSIKQLSDKEFSVGAETLSLELGTYNPNKQNFPVSIRNKTQGIQIAMNGTIQLPRDEARKFKQEYTSGLVRPQATVKAGSGDVIRIALANDSDNMIYEYVDGEFITVAERKRRAAAAAELERQTVGEMVSVPAGCFNPGNSQVCLDAFRIGKYEVTQGQYKRIMGSNPSRFSSCGDDCPVENVSWNDAQNFISKLNGQTGKRYRLPTEAEWHYACTRGGKSEEYCGGYDVDAVAWYDKNSGNKTHRVGEKQPNGLGIYDMSGNVWEWVNDCFGDNYPSSNRNPQGPSCSDQRVLRGGSWTNDDRNTRGDDRGWLSPDTRGYYFGLRLAVSED